MTLETIRITSVSSVNSLAIPFRAADKMTKFSTPTIASTQTNTRAWTLAGPVSVAPIKLAIRVEAAIDTGKGI